MRRSPPPFVSWYENGRRTALRPVALPRARFGRQECCKVNRDGAGLNRDSELSRPSTWNNTGFGCATGRRGCLNCHGYRVDLEGKVAVRSGFDGLSRVYTCARACGVFSPVTSVTSVTSEYYQWVIRDTLRDKNGTRHGFRHAPCEDFQRVGYGRAA